MIASTPGPGFGSGPISGLCCCSVLECPRDRVSRGQSCGMSLGELRVQIIAAALSESRTASSSPSPHIYYLSSSDAVFYLKTSSKSSKMMLKPFRIRNLYDSSPGVVQLTTVQYDCELSTLSASYSFSSVTKLSQLFLTCNSNCQVSTRRSLVLP